MTHAAAKFDAFDGYECVYCVLRICVYYCLYGVLNESWAHMHTTTASLSINYVIISLSSHSLSLYILYIYIERERER